jgi:hypothetical protein
MARVRGEQQAVTASIRRREMSASAWDELVDQAAVEGPHGDLFVGLAVSSTREPGQSPSSASACRPSMPGIE